jgi:hypothetical protein
MKPEGRRDLSIWLMGCIVIGQLCVTCANRIEGAPEARKAVSDYIAFESTRAKRYPENTPFAELPDRAPLLDVFLTGPEGSNVILVSRDRTQSGSFFRGRCRWSPDRKWLAWPGEIALFVSDRSGNTQLVYQHEPLQHPSYGVLPPWGFAWGPGSDRLAIWKSSSKIILIVLLNGKVEREIPVQGNGTLTGLDWSSRNVLAEVTNEGNGSYCICALDAGDENANSIKILGREGPIKWVSFSRDGRNIAFVGSAKTGQSLSWVSVDGSQGGEILKNLAGKEGSPDYWQQWYGEWLCYRPRWHPDGKRLVYGDRSHVYVVDKDGSSTRDLTPAGMIAEAPVWSPDGGRIAFHGKRADERFSIWTMDEYGTNCRRITGEASGNDVYPEWAP